MRGPPVPSAFLLCADCARAFWARGALCMAVSTLIMTSSALCVKLTNGRVPIFEIVLFRSLFSAVLCGVLARAQRIPLLFGPRRLWPAYAVRGFPGAASMVFYYQAIAMLPLSDAMTLMYSNPALCAVFAWIVGTEAVTCICMAGVGASVVGVVLIAQPPFLFGEAAWDHTRLLGSVSGILAALTAAIAFTAIKFVPKSEPTVVLAMWFHCSALVTAIVPLAVGVPEWPTIPCGHDLGLLAGVSLTSFLGQYTLNRSFQLLAASHASAVNTLQVLWGHLYGVLIVGEPETVFAVTGSALIAGSGQGLNAIHCLLLLYSVPLGCDVGRAMCIVWGV
ncbi:hypothetical protein WJX81_004641 [Elliptochloris bilobata]|uniref:EamA domain-containing protein n=1 Tax=Elliptochloris bilobata TaxID=381761 RepID=A0AAW1QZE2_9CHLO